MTGIRNRSFYELYINMRALNRITLLSQTRKCLLKIEEYFLKILSRSDAFDPITHAEPLLYCAALKDEHVRHVILETKRSRLQHAQTHTYLSPLSFLSCFRSIESAGHRAVNCAVTYGVSNASLLYAECSKRTRRVPDAEFIGTRVH
jgi:hypothetical protein